MKRAVVTGGTSFLGRAILDELIGDDYDCFAIVRPESANLTSLPISERLKIVSADMGDMVTWVETIEAADLFFHFGWDGVGAAGRASNDIQKGNLEKTLLCLKGAKALGCKRFLFAGSQAECGITHEIITESTPCYPQTEYGKGKLQVLCEAQRQAQVYGIEYVHMRIFSVYGPGDHSWALVPSCVKAFANKEAILLSDCMQKWNFLYSTDAAVVIRLLAQCPLIDTNPVYNVASMDTRVLKDFVEELWDLAGQQGQPVYGGRQNAAENPPWLQPDISRLQRMTQWQPLVTFAQGVAELLKKEREK